MGATRVEANLLGYRISFHRVDAAAFGVPQRRQRTEILGLRREIGRQFKERETCTGEPPTVAGVLRELLAENGWRGVDRGARFANDVAPIIVGGSKKHGGPDLGPRRARQAWPMLGVDGRSLANEAPAADFVGTPRLRLPMVARIQGFPDDWVFAGKKTRFYRQIGSAFPPPVAAAMVRQIRRALIGNRLERWRPIMPVYMSA